VAGFVEETWVVTTREQAPAVESLPGVTRVIVEPFGRNTAAAVALAVAHATDRAATLIALPADHHVTDVEGFVRHLHAACVHAEASATIATLGIEPSYPATGFGYIERAVDPRAAIAGDDEVAVFEALRFVEKPDEQRAREFLEVGRFLWNAGVFVMPRERIATELARHCARLWSDLDGALDTPARLEAAYRRAPSTPIDIAVMEKIDGVVVAPTDVGWTDLGSWQALYELADKDGAGNAALSAGPAPVLVDSEGSLAWAENDQIALIGLRDVMVVQSGDRILVAPRSDAQRVRAVVEALRERSGSR